MIYLASDTHGGDSMAGLSDFAPDKENDLLIFLGDLGIFWDDSPQSKAFDEFILSRDYPMAFIDGNHENCDRILSFPVEEWNGGRVHRLSKNLVHLMRGEIYTIQSSTFFCMGGCRSSDRWKSKKAWWVQEEPTKEEYDFAYENLEKHGFRVDYILTHKYFTPEQQDFSGNKYSVEALHGFIDTHVTFRHWYSGHWHRTYPVDDTHDVIFLPPAPLPPKK